jgi:hypothetical protein
MSKIIFDNNTDYEDVYRITELIYGDVAARGEGCCDDHRRQLDGY